MLLKSAAWFENGIRTEGLNRGVDPAKLTKVGIPHPALNESSHSVIFVNLSMAHYIHFCGGHLGSDCKNRSKVTKNGRGEKKRKKKKKVYPQHGF